MDAPLPSAPTPTAPATEGLAFAVALVVCVAAGVAAVVSEAPGTAAAMLLLAGACFVALYARGHLTQR